MTASSLCSGNLSAGFGGSSGSAILLTFDVVSRFFGKVQAGSAGRPLGIIGFSTRVTAGLLSTTTAFSFLDQSKGFSEYGIFTLGL